MASISLGGRWGVCTPGPLTERIGNRNKEPGGEDKESSHHGCDYDSTDTVLYSTSLYITELTVLYCTPLTVGAMVSTYPIHIDDHCLLSIGHVTWTIHLVPLVPRTPMTLQTVPSRLREIPPTHRPRRESSLPSHPPLLDLELPGTISPPVRHSTRPPSSLRPTVRPGQPL